MPPKLKHDFKFKLNVYIKFSNKQIGEIKKLTVELMRRRKSRNHF